MSGGIELPWPPKELNPNARIHHMAKAQHTKLYREQAYWIAHNAVRGKIEYQALPSGSGPIALTISFSPPDRRRRDIDGMLSSIKAGLDAIADALLVNDHRFELTLKRAEPVKGGRVTVTVG